MRMWWVTVILFTCTYIAKVLIQQFNISMQHFQSQQLVVLVLQTTAEIQTGIPVYTTANHLFLVK